MYYGHLSKEEFIPIILGICKKGKGHSVRVQISHSCVRDMPLSECVNMLCRTKCNHYRISKEVYNYLLTSWVLPEKIKSDIQLGICEVGT